MRSWEKVVATDQRFTFFLERRCRSLQRKTGWTNFTLARVVVVLTLLAILAGVERGIFFLSGATYFPFFCVLALPLFWKWLKAELANVKKQERAALSRLREGTANSAKVDPITTVVRVILAFNAAMGLPLFWGFGYPWVGATAFAFFFGALVGSYLIFLDPLPPCRNRLRERIESLFLTPIPIKSGDR